MFCLCSLEHDTHAILCMVSCTKLYVSCDWLPAVYECRFVSCLPLDFGELLHNINHNLEVGAHSIWSPACDVELSHLVCCFGLNITQITLSVSPTLSILLLCCLKYGQLSFPPISANYLDPKLIISGLTTTYLIL